MEHKINTSAGAYTAPAQLDEMEMRVVRESIDSLESIRKASE